MSNDESNVHHANESLKSDFSGDHNTGNSDNQHLSEDQQSNDFGSADHSDGSSTQVHTVHSTTKRHHVWVTGVADNMGQVGYPGYTFDPNSYGPGGDFGSRQSRQGLGYGQGDWDNTTQPGLIVGGSFGDDVRLEHSGQHGSDADHPSLANRIISDVEEVTTHVEKVTTRLFGDAEEVASHLLGDVEEVAGRLAGSPDLVERGHAHVHKADTTQDNTNGSAK